MSSIPSVDFAHERQQQTLQWGYKLDAVSNNFTRATEFLRYPGARLSEHDIEELTNEFDAVRQFKNALEAPNSPIPLVLATKINNLARRIPDLEKQLEDKCYKRTLTVTVASVVTLSVLLAGAVATELLRLRNFNL
jgi:hypothetical protein